MKVPVTRVQKANDKLIDFSLIFSSFKKFPHNHCDLSFETKFTMFLMHLAKEINICSANSDSLAFLSSIEFLLEVMKQKSENTKNLVEKFWVIAKQNKWLEKYGIQDRNNIPESLDLWLYSLKKEDISELICFIEKKDIAAWLNSFIQTFLEKSTEINFESFEFLLNLSGYKEFFEKKYFPKMLNASCNPGFNRLDILFDLAGLYMERSIPVEGPVKPFIKRINQLVMANINSQSVHQIFNMLELNAKVVRLFANDLLSVEEKEAVVNFVLGLKLDLHHLRALFDFRWIIFDKISAKLLQSLDEYLKVNLPEDKLFSWAPQIEEFIEQDEFQPDVRVLPYMDFQKEKRVLKEIKDVKKRKVVPGDCNQKKLGALSVCAHIMQKMGLQSVTRDSFINLSLVVNTLNAIYHSESMPELEYNLGILIGAFNVWGWFDKYSMFEYIHMTTGNVLSVAMLDKDFARRLGFLKSTNLFKYGKTVILSKILDSSYEVSSICDITDIKIISKMPISLFSSLSSVVIPDIFKRFQSNPVVSEFDVFVSRVKMTLLYDMNLRSTEAQFFLSTIKKYVDDNVNNLTENEICQYLKLCELYEARHGVKVLTREQRELMLDKVLLIPEREWASNGNLIRFKWSMFNEMAGDKFLTVNEGINKYCTAREKRAEVDAKKQSHPHEKILADAIIERLPLNEKGCIRMNYVCPKVGREIDIAYLDEDMKIAIHIDGTPFHLYKGSDNNNADTTTSRLSLRNAGWHNIALRLYPDTCIDEQYLNYFAEEVVKQINLRKRREQLSERKTDYTFSISLSSVTVNQKSSRVDSATPFFDLIKNRYRKEEINDRKVIESLVAEMTSKIHNMEEKEREIRVRSQNQQKKKKGVKKKLNKQGK